MRFHITVTKAPRGFPSGVFRDSRLDADRVYSYHHSEYTVRLWGWDVTLDFEKRFSAKRPERRKNDA